MADEEAPAPRQKPSLDRSMSTKAAFAKAFVSAHAVPTFDQPMLIYHGGGIAICLLFALLLPLMRLDSDKGFLAGVVWALCFLFGAFFYVCASPRHATHLRVLVFSGFESSAAARGCFRRPAAQPAGARRAVHKPHRRAAASR